MDLSHVFDMERRGDIYADQSYAWFTDQADDCSA